MRIRGFISAVVLGAALAFSPSCSVFQSACTKSLPVMVAAQSYAFEADAALIDARAAIESSGLSNAAKVKARDAIDKAQAGLQSAGAALAAASTACNTPDVATVFESFVVAWDVVRGFLALVGGDGVRPVADPSIYVMARGAQ